MTTCSCGASIPQISAKCHECGKERSHRDCYQDQYAHPLVGKQVEVKTHTGFTTRGRVTRVVQCRYGTLAHLDNSGTTAYLVSDCKQV